MILETNKEISKLTKLFVETAKENGLNIKEDEWKLIQPFKNGQAITISTVNDGNRKMLVDVDDSTFVLDAIDGELDVFGRGGKINELTI